MSSLILDQIKNLMVGARMPRISEADFKKLKVVLPPLQTQKEIVAKIEKMRAEVQNLQEQSANILKTAKAEMRKAILGDKKVNYGEFATIKIHETGNYQFTYQQL